MNIVIPQASLPILSKAIPSSSSKAASAAAKAARFPVNRIYCIGRNYREHAIEMGHDPDREPPFFFQKPADAVVDASSKSCIIPVRFILILTC
jgi:2-keto-4-pentenoate hydratase/2-oxohepta-3-ene-1,7-dioic acid hydratase in catechol pathway